MSGGLWGEGEFHIWIYFLFFVLQPSLSFDAMFGLYPPPPPSFPRLPLCWSARTFHTPAHPHPDFSISFNKNLPQSNNSPYKILTSKYKILHFLSMLKHILEIQGLFLIIMHLYDFYVLRVCPHPRI